MANDKLLMAIFLKNNDSLDWIWGLVVKLIDFRRPFIKLKFVKSLNKYPITSTLFTTSLLLLLYCFFVYLLPIFLKGFFVTVKLVKPCFSVCTYVLFFFFFF